VGLTWFASTAGLNDVLPVSQLELGTVDLALERPDARAVGAERVEALRSRAQQAGVHLSVEIPDGPSTSAPMPCGAS
jgi:signal transduction histidine kinase